MAISVQEFIQQLEEEPTLCQRLVLLLKDRESEPQLVKMPYQEFLEWMDEDTLAEWEDGEIIMSSPASYFHQDLVRFLTSVVGMYVETYNLGVICPAPFQMKLEYSGREPDLLFVAQKHLDRLKETYLDGPADLVVEIISPESVVRDRGKKFYEYEEGGVPEFWLIDPLRKWAEFYQLRPEGRYKTAFAGQEGIYHAVTLKGFWLRVEWLWQETPPHPLRALGEITGMSLEVVENFLKALGGETR